MSWHKSTPVLYLNYAFAVILLVLTGYPYVFMVMSSFKTQQAYSQDPFSFLVGLDFSNYVLAFHMGLSRYFLNTLIITVLSVLLIVLLASMASYPLSRMRLKYGRLLLLLFASGMMLPIHSTLIPVYKLTVNVGLYDSLMALLGPYIAFNLPVSIFILTQFMGELPREIEEAAEVDGCSHVHIFSRITLPMIKPAISTIVIYSFIHIWSEFIFSLILITSPENKTLPLGLQKYSDEFSTNVPGLLAALTLTSLPILLIYIAAQEKIVTGITGGAVKS